MNRWHQDKRLSDRELARVIDDAFGSRDGFVIRSSIACLRREDVTAALELGRRDERGDIAAWLRQEWPESIPEPRLTVGICEVLSRVADDVERGAHVKSMWQCEACAYTWGPVGPQGWCPQGCAALVSRVDPA